MLAAKFTPVWTSTPLKEAEARPPTPKSPEAKEESNDSFYDDEAFAKKLAGKPSTYVDLSLTLTLRTQQRRHLPSPSRGPRSGPMEAGS